MAVEFQNPKTSDFVVHEIAYVLMGGFYGRYAKSLALRGDERVLELGSGGGALSQRLLRYLTDGGSLTCVDTSAAWMDRARRRLAKAGNVHFHCGDLAGLDIPDASHDVAVIHLMLHDVPEENRHDLVSALAAKLKPSGRLAIREPIGRRHSLPEPELKELLSAAGLTEIGAKHTKNIWMGELYEGVWEKG